MTFVIVHKQPFLVPKNIMEIRNVKFAVYLFSNDSGRVPREISTGPHKAQRQSGTLPAHQISSHVCLSRLLALEKIFT